MLVQLTGFTPAIELNWPWYSELHPGDLQRSPRAWKWGTCASFQTFPVKREKENI